MTANKEKLHHIVIVGGGAGGLELATRLGNKLGKRNKALITLVDKTSTHLWKPLLHEVAAGSLNSYEDELGYLGQAYRHFFQFRLGEMDGIDRRKKQISLAATRDHQGFQYIPRRYFSYDTLIIAVGSITNDFNIAGIDEHCFFLDTRHDADSFHQNLLKHFFAADTQQQPLKDNQLHIAIAGAGATGVELSAELHRSAYQLSRFGLENIKPGADVKITLIEAADRILPLLPPRLSEKTRKALEKLNVQVLTNTRVTEATTDGFKIADGSLIPAVIKVWAAGIKAPIFLKHIDDLETNHVNQLLVKLTLQTTLDENIFAFGDCAACPLTSDNNGKTVPPRAQSAHQQANMLVKTIQRRLTGKPLPKYQYVDFGSLVNLGNHTTVGHLMGNISKISGSIMMEGLVARFIYLSLYKMHQYALHGMMNTILSSLGNLLNRANKPRMKLH